MCYWCKCKASKTYLFKEGFEMIPLIAQGLYIILNVLHVLLKIQESNLQLISFLNYTKQLRFCSTSLKI